MYDICLKTTSEAALIAALTPLGLTAKDEAGNSILKTASHNHALAYFGRVQATPAEIDIETGSVTTEATYLPGEYAVLRGDEALVKQIMAATMDGVEVLADAPAGCPTFGGWTPLPAGPSLDEVKAVRILAATAACDAVLAPLGKEYGAYEMATWDQQYSEALAYKANPTADVPLLASMCVARGVSIAALADRVVANRNAWVALTGNVIGQRQRIVDQISAAETVEAVMAVDMTITLPG